MIHGHAEKLQKARNLRRLVQCLLQMDIAPFKMKWFNPLPDDKILDWSKLKQIADDILKHIKNEK